MPPIGPDEWHAAFRRATVGLSALISRNAFACALEVNEYGVHVAPSSGYLS